MKQHFIDLHIHSRFSRATSKNLNLENLNLWGQYKGLSLIGTGDMTHPMWLEEMENSLVLNSEGLYVLKNAPDGVKFIPSGEVSAIYKQDGKTRKIHLVVIAPDLEAAQRFSKFLGSRGNIHSDGRPILGLSARDILEIALTASPDMVVVPAHIWTPWFSLFGSKSGFDRLEDCFKDLSEHITALETGLSSDPEMNRLVSSLDKYALISSSDAHSPEKLAREATILNGSLSKKSLWDLLKGGSSLGGTVEFYPEEGKYHLDGHLNCGPALSPQESEELNEICPVCHKPLTIGVLNRVMKLADRSKAPANLLLPDQHLVPLVEIISQIINVGTASRKVANNYQKLIYEFKSELNLLLNVPIDDIKIKGGDLLALAIDKVRQGKIIAQGGYDGKFGVIKVITEDERKELSGQGVLFDNIAKKSSSKPSKIKKSELKKVQKIDQILMAQETRVYDDILLDSLDESQRKALLTESQYSIVSAGPGSGKTKFLTHKAAWLIREKKVQASKLLLTTYTKKAAETLKERLENILPFKEDIEQIKIGTLHALAYNILKQSSKWQNWNIGDEEILENHLKVSAKKYGFKVNVFKSQLSLNKNRGNLFRISQCHLDDNFVKAALYYQNLLQKECIWDYDDLLLEVINPEINLPTFNHIMIDEFQDISPVQYAFLNRFLVNNPTCHLTAIGDPDQSIYSFRGAKKEIFKFFIDKFPNTTSYDLKYNYRSTANIMSLGNIICPAKEERFLAPTQIKKPNELINKIVLDSPRQEAWWVAQKILDLLGVLDLGKTGSSAYDQHSLDIGMADIAVIFRLRSLGLEVSRALSELGLSWQMSGEEEISAIDGMDFKADKISLLTMHASKGLEFKVVFIIGLEQALIPYYKPNIELTEEEKKEQFEEEKRLFYVGITRAKNLLFLTRSSKRILHGQLMEGASLFWNYCDKNISREIKIKNKKAKKNTIGQAKLF